ncbi:MAG: hypothetical protein ABSA14_02930 [Acidimicrobiales bacterium]|jgi:hypothetical protein
MTEHERKAAATAIWADAMRETGRDPDMVVTDAVKTQDESPDDVVIQDGQTGGAGSGAGGWGYWVAKPKVTHRLPVLNSGIWCRRSTDRGRR